MTPIEEWHQWIDKVGLQFLKEEDLSKSDKEKRAQNFNKQLQKLKKEVLMEGILNYFKDFEKNFFHPFKEKIGILSLSYDNVLIVIFWLCPNLRLK